MDTYELDMTTDDLQVLLDEFEGFSFSETVSHYWELEEKVIVGPVFCTVGPDLGVKFSYTLISDSQESVARSGYAPPKKAVEVVDDHEVRKHILTTYGI